MVFYVDKCKIKIEYSFIILISFALLLNVREIFYVILFAALHEAGHLALLLILGGKPLSITVSFYGVGLKHDSYLDKYKEILFLSGGIIVNSIFSLLIIKREINLALLIVNVLPLYPLDGGRIIKLLFGIKERYFYLFTYIFSVFLFILAVYIRNVSLILISVYVFIFTLNEDLK